ncbi:hypothetical protein LNV23_06005 [Paucibacter sp. DJ1R-11]|uniref:hypothetical protein n=1 Tax=Paucibacter sp. DJ1R-11 TaxID=2893556 RepID=UPI0021E46D46|nr:hypothetical protein [Paucibacter sp. DJ1R-11]MCV2363006.1 hypothetical protein [Paucibacter sp. DJ1R-11]
MRNVVAGTLEFHEFSVKTTRLLIGSRDESTSHESINILNILYVANKRYPGLKDWYTALCESAHPNYEGMLLGYSTSDSQSHVTRFENRWNSLFGKSHQSALQACLDVFVGEYNDEWPAAHDALEQWLEKNDAKLEATKPKTN